jgi:hypothetical protein
MCYAGRQQDSGLFHPPAGASNRKDTVNKRRAPMPTLFNRPAWTSGNFSAKGQVRTGWEQVGGNAVFFEFYQLGTLRALNATKENSTTIQVAKNNQKVAFDVIGGICNALVLRFIENRLHGVKAAANAADLKANFGAEMTRQAQIKAKIEDGYTLATQQRYVSYKGGTFGSRAVGSRAQLVDVICSQASLWLYRLQKGNNEHAIGIDSRYGEVHFFDPDCGYFYTDKKPQPGSAESLKLKTFLYQLWNTIPYKQKYSGGSRWLYKYG